ncbi:MAG: HAD hydrolase family protein [Rikenellaceae bacterium]
MGNFKEDIALCEAIILDVDGVLTDGGIIPLIDGDFIRKYNAKDGYALAYAVKEGYKICIISGGRGASLLNRIKALGIEYYYIDCMDKIAAINDFCAKTGVNLDHAVYMGDDIPDLDCMKLVGIPVAPADAASEAIEAARYVSEYKGGCGCVRDIIEQVLRAKGDWAKHTGGVTGGHVASR